MLKPTYQNKKYPMQRIFNLILDIELWTLSKTSETKFEAFEMRVYRSKLRISRVYKITKFGSFEENRKTIEYCKIGLKKEN